MSCSHWLSAITPPQLQREESESNEILPAASIGPTISSVVWTDYGNPPPPILAEETCYGYAVTWTYWSYTLQGGPVHGNQQGEKEKFVWTNSTEASEYSGASESEKTALRVPYLRESNVNSLLHIGKPASTEWWSECEGPEPLPGYRPCCTVYPSHHRQPRARRHLSRGTATAVSLGLVRGPCRLYLLPP